MESFPYLCLRPKALAGATALLSVLDCVAVVSLPRILLEVCFRVGYGFRHQAVDISPINTKIIREGVKKLLLQTYAQPSVLSH